MPTGRKLLPVAATAALATALLNSPAAVADAPAPPSPVACDSCWHPDLNTSWNWVLSQVPTAPYRTVSMYDVDGFNNSASDVNSLHAAGIKAVCYISAGSYENGRPDASRFPASVLGNVMDGWPNEKWLDVREIQNSASALRQIMDARLDMCQSKGFDMVELDNVDGYTNNTGFPLTATDQLYYAADNANDFNGVLYALNLDDSVFQPCR